MTPILLGPGTGISPLAPGTPPSWPKVMGQDVPGAWLGAAGARRCGAAAFSHHQPSMGPWPQPRRGQAKEGPFDSRRQARELGLLFQCSAVCADGAPCAPRWGLCFSWLGMCSALLASAGRGGPHWGPLLPAGPRPRAKQGLLQDHLRHSCGEEGEMGDVSRTHLMAPPWWGHIIPAAAGSGD